MLIGTILPCYLIFRRMSSDEKIGGLRHRYWGWPGCPSLFYKHWSTTGSSTATTLSTLGALTNLFVPFRYIPISVTQTQNRSLSHRYWEPLPAWIIDRAPFHSISQFLLCSAQKMPGPQRIKGKIVSLFQAKLHSTRYLCIAKPVPPLTGTGRFFLQHLSNEEGNSSSAKYGLSRSVHLTP